MPRQESPKVTDAVRLVQAGMPRTIAARETGIPVMTIVRACQRHGLPPGERGRPMGSGVKAPADVLQAFRRKLARAHKSGNPDAITKATKALYDAIRRTTQGAA